MENRQQLLRSIPKMDALLRHPLLAASGHSVALLTRAARQILDSLRLEIQENLRQTPCAEEETAALVVALAARLAMPSLRLVLNATGIPLHTNLGRAPLAPSAVEQVTAVAKGYSTLEYDLEKGERGSRYSHVESLLTRLTGAEAAMVVNNNAAAVLLMLSALTKDREVPVSRGELVEIGGSFRVPDVMAQSGTHLIEVGATNKTHLYDYENAIGPQTKALLKVHTSNYKVIGFTQEVGLEELSALAQKHGLLLLHDLGSGLLAPLHGLGLEDEPTVAESLAKGADMVTFSGDKLLGGPQAGILLGRKELIAQIKRHPLTRALRIDKLTLAALEGTLRLYEEPQRALAEIPTLEMLARCPQELEKEAMVLKEMLQEATARYSELKNSWEVLPQEGQVGGGSAPGVVLPTFAVALAYPNLPVLEEALRHAPTPVVVRIAKDRMLFDLRTLHRQEYDTLCQSICWALEQEGRA